MKKFITKTVKFSILPLLLILVFDLYLRNIDTLYSAKYDGLMRIKEDINVLFLGNSHANYAINPLYIKDYDSYNIANVSQKIYFDIRLAKKAINDGVSNLKYVFISVDYHSLFTSSQGVRNTWSFYENGIKYKTQDYTKAQISPFIWGYTPRVSISLLSKNILRKINHSAINYDVENGVNTKDTLYRGFIGFTGSKSTSFSDANYKRKANDFKENINNTERVEVIEDLTRFITFLKSKGIEPILFSSPTYKEYNAYLDKEQIKRNIEDIHQICNKFDIQYWRFNEDNRFLKDDFYNQDHMNKKGASKFCAILNKKLKNHEKLKTRNITHN